MGRDRKQDVNLEAGAVAVLETRRHHRHAATCNTFAVDFEPRDFTQNRLAGGSGCLETFERNCGTICMSVSFSLRQYY